MKRRLHNQGFSLVEMLIYIAVLVIIFLAVVSTVLSFTTSYRTLAAMRIVERSAMDAMERMTRDIRAASSVDTVNSTLDANPGVLVLVASEGGVSTTTRFYIDTNAVKVDVNGTYVGPLTTENVAINNLTFTLSTTTRSTAVKIDMTLQGTSGTAVQTKSYHTTVILKGS
jgi:type II secretory pathway pseudopilin PulG